MISMRAKTTSLLMALLAAFFGVFASSAQAFAADGDVTIAFTARVESATSPGPGPRGRTMSKAYGVKAGDTITGIYTYNALTPDENIDDTTVGDYWHRTSNFGITVSSRKKVIAKTDPLNVEFLVEIVNRDDSDNYLLRSYNNINASHISWQLDDPTRTALQSDALPTEPPTLAAWQSLFGLTVEGNNGEFLRAHVTEVHKL